MDPDIYVYEEELLLMRHDASFSAGFCLCEFSTFQHFGEIVRLLHPREFQYFETLKFEKRSRHYLIGRLTAKKAVAALLGEADLTKIAILKGIFTQPLVISNAMPNIQVSISHSDVFGAAIAFPEAHPMGIDIEMVDGAQNEAIARETTPAEIALIRQLPYSDEVQLTILWTVKEALAKVLKTGLMTPFKIFEIEHVECRSGSVTCAFRNFGQYQAVSFLIRDHVCSIVYPLKTELSIDIQSIKKCFPTDKIDL